MTALNQAHFLPFKIKIEENKLYKGSNGIKYTKSDRLGGFGAPARRFRETRKYSPVIIPLMIKKNVSNNPIHKAAIFVFIGRGGFSIIC